MTNKNVYGKIFEALEAKDFDAFKASVRMTIAKKCAASVKKTAVGLVASESAKSIKDDLHTTILESKRERNISAFIEKHKQKIVESIGAKKHFVKIGNAEKFVSALMKNKDFRARVYEGVKKDKKFNIADFAIEYITNLENMNVK